MQLTNLHKYFIAYVIQTLDRHNETEMKWLSRVYSVHINCSRTVPWRGRIEARRAGGTVGSRVRGTVQYSRAPTQLTPHLLAILSGGGGPRKQVKWDTIGHVLHCCQGNRSTMAGYIVALSLLHITATAGWRWFMLIDVTAISFNLL